MSHGKTYIVRRLDGFDQDVTVDKKATGGDLLDKVRAVRSLARNSNGQRKCMRLCTCCILRSLHGGETFVHGDCLLAYEH